MQDTQHYSLVMSPMGKRSLGYIANSDVVIFGVLTSASQPTNTDTVGGVLFTVALLMPTSPHFVSQLNFTASDIMNGSNVLCEGSSGSADLLAQAVRLEVESISKHNCLLLFVM